MSNTNAPFGFRPSRKVPGSGMDFGMTTRLIKGTSNTTVFKGDPVVWDAANPGYVTTVASPGTATIVGIAVGFQWLQTVQGSLPWASYFSGSAAVQSGDVSVLVIDDPNAIFLVQAGATAIAQLDVGANIQYVAGSGNTLNGISGAYLNTTSNTTNTLPFQVYSLPGAPITDPTSAYNLVEVTFNNQIYKNLTGN